MRQWIRTVYGGPQVLQLVEAPIPTPNADEVVVKLSACALNASDVEFLTGVPGYIPLLSALKHKCLGSDIAGIVHAIGDKVTEFKVGDAVFGDVFETFGGLGEYCIAKEKQLVLKPESLRFEQVAGIPQASTVSLQAIRDKAQLKQGESILLIGAGGGSGSFAIQIAKLLGASSITAVDCAEKEAIARELGATEFIDYKKETAKGQFDVVIDFIGKNSSLGFGSLLTATGRYVMVGGSLSTLLTTAIASPLLSWGSKKYGILIHNQNQTDIKYITDLILNGVLKVTIGKQFDASETPSAFESLMSGTVPGKVIIAWS
jgi:NADPH:quinone reductase-like Zn-dependent oxidoreductase